MFRNVENYFLQIEEGYVLRELYYNSDVPILTEKINEHLTKQIQHFENHIAERTKAVNRFKKQFGAIIVDEGVEQFSAEMLRATEGNSLDLSQVKLMKENMEANLKEQMKADEVEITFSHV